MPVKTGLIYSKISYISYSIRQNLALALLSLIPLVFANP